MVLLIGVDIKIRIFSIVFSTQSCLNHNTIPLCPIFLNLQRMIAMA